MLFLAANKINLPE